MMDDMGTGFRRFVAVAILLFVGVGTWIVGTKLASDAIGMLIGILCGTMAGIPTMLLWIALNRYNANHRHEQWRMNDTPPTVQYITQRTLIVDSRTGEVLRAIQQLEGAGQELLGSRRIGE